MAVDSGNKEAAGREHSLWSPRHRVPESAGPFVPEASAELLRTIAGVLDIRAVFPRISDIVKQVVPHDSLALKFSDRAGRITLEARSSRELPEHRWNAAPDGREFTIVSDLRRVPSQSTDDEPGDVDRLVAAGYRSMLSVRAVAQTQIMQLGFFSKQVNAYTHADVPAARHVADYVAVSVAHEQLAAAERDRAEARGRSERVAARVRAVADKGEPITGRDRMVGRSEEWQRVLTRVLRVASTDTTVFLQGESGTGKEVVARFIHEASHRKDGPFVAINCAALPEQLLESELFGYERGAFTGALQSKAGQIELAARGTLFLDEVSEMSLLAQAKFLRFLQEREFQRLGGTRVQKANVRVIAATNRILGQAVERGTFREDLFYRLQVFDIQLPPLRDRNSDVLLLAEHFLKAFADASGGPPARLSDEARDALVAHSWPGNIRELRNVLEAASILSDEGVIERRHLSLHGARVAPSSNPQDLAAMERQTIEKILQQTDWNKSKTARLLGLTRTQLYVRLRRYGLEKADD
jgi:transcriptional regulator with PAS, ATPase and Fis domain